MRELGVGGQVQKPDRLRQLQHGRRGEQEIVGNRDDGADYAGVGCVLVVIVIRRLLPLCRFAGRSKRGLLRGVGQTGIREADLNRLPCGLVEMPERQRKLDRERQQRQPRAVLEVFPEPVHDELRLPRTAKVPQKLSWPPMLYYNIGRERRSQLWLGRGSPELEETVRSPQRRSEDRHSHRLTK
jgi:hypothetical protein